MKILHIIATSDPAYGGPIEGILRQDQVTRPLGITRELVTLDGSDAPHLQNMPLKVHPLGVALYNGQRWNPILRYGFTPKLIPWLRNNISSYDCVVVNGLWNYATLAASFVLRRSDTPYIVFTHGMLDPWFKKYYPLKHWAKQLFWLFCEGPLLKHANAVIFTTEEERRLARTSFWGYSYHEKVVGYGTADVTGDKAGQKAAFMAHLPQLRGRKFFLFLSRLHPKKGCDLLIESFSNIAARYPEVDLVIAGPDQVGWKRDLESIAASLGIAHRVHWPGMLAGDVKWGAFRAAEAFILPSHSENFGIVVAEALACATPVLISDKVNIWREVESSGGGLVEADNLPGTTRLLLKFLELDCCAKREMRAKARKCFLENFEITSFARNLIIVLRGGVDGK